MKMYSCTPTKPAVGGQLVMVKSEAGLDYKLPHVLRHSHDGFNFGYGGSGPADLALSILVDTVGETLADKWYQQFKWDIIARLPRDNSWTITDSQIFAWLKEKGEEV